MEKKSNKINRTAECMIHLLEFARFVLFFFFNLTIGGIISFFDRAGVFVKLTVIVVLPGKSSCLMY